MSIIDTLSLRRARMAVTINFLIMGILFGTWATRVPDISNHLRLSPGTLGIALFGLEAGAIIGLPLAGMLVVRFGVHRVIQMGLLINCLTLILIALAPILPILTGVLVAFAMGNSFLDVALNTAGVAVEQGYRRPILSSFHAFWSIGGLLGSFIGTGAVTIGLPVLLHFGLVSILWLVVGLLATCWLLPTPARISQTRGFSRPSKPILLLGSMALCAFLMEGVMTGWSSLYLRDSVGTNAGLAALGFAIFNCTMVGGRLITDGLVAHIGWRWFVRGAALLIIGGISFAVLIATPTMTLVGFGLIGLGIAGIAPIALSQAGYQASKQQTEHAIASVTTIGYFGSLSAPALIGWLAQLSSLQLALSMVIIPAGFIIMFSYWFVSGPLSSSDVRPNGDHSRPEARNGTN